MKEENFSPEQGFETIASVIRDAKAKIEENGIIYLGWGVLISFAAFTQYYLLHNGYATINYYPYFLMPIGVVASAIHGIRNGKAGRRSHLSDVIASIWVSVSLSVMMLGFFLASVLGASLMPLIMILLSIGIMTSGATIKSSILLVSGVLMNLIGFYAFTWDISQQPLLMGIASVLCVLLPGILLMGNHKRKHV